MTFGRGKVYWGTDFQQHIVGGVSDLQRTDESRFSVSATEGLRSATLESFQLLRWDAHPQAKRAVTCETRQTQDHFLSVRYFWVICVRSFVFFLHTFVMLVTSLLVARKFIRIIIVKIHNVNLLHKFHASALHNFHGQASFPDAWTRLM